MADKTYLYDVFISYRWVSPDQDWVRNQLYPALVNAGLKVCLDVENFRPGQDLILEMEKAGLESRQIVCVISPEYFEEGRMVEFENLSARRRDPAGRSSVLIPFILREAKIPDRISGLISIDWTNRAHHEREWRKLLEVLNAPELNAPPPGDHQQISKTPISRKRRETTEQVAPHQRRVAPGNEETSVEIDFAIITAIEIERKAVCTALSLTDDQRVRKGSRVYWRGRLPVADGFYEIVVAQSLDMANVDAALLTSDVIRDWQPGAMLMVGIAASANREVNLGDVVVASNVHYYERGKVGPEGVVKLEPYIYPADSTLWSNILALPEWKTRIAAKRPDLKRVRPKVHHGVIASGERVIAYAALRDEIASSHRKTLAIEMEGYGFSKAASQSFEQVRHLVIRAICDDGSETKNDKWHAYAAAAAASYARHFLADQPLEPRNTQRSAKPAERLETGSTEVYVEDRSKDFWTSSHFDSLIHQRNATGDPTVLVILVNGDGEDPSVLWGDGPKLLLENLGTDLDVIAFGSSLGAADVVNEAARLRRTILSRPQPYMHMFFLTTSQGSSIVSEMLVQDIEFISGEPNGTLSQLPPIAAKTRAIFNFETESRPAQQRAASRRRARSAAGFQDRFKQSFERLKANDFPRPRLILFVPAENPKLDHIKHFTDQTELVEFVHEPASSDAPKSRRNETDSRLSIVAAHLRRYCNSPDMIVSYITNRRCVSLDGGTKPTFDSRPEGTSRRDWLGWEGSQQFVLNQLDRLSQPRLRHQHPRILITGSAGVGKSIILRRHARRISRKFLETQSSSSLSVVIPTQNMTLSERELALMPPAGTTKTGWRVFSEYLAALVGRIVVDPVEEDAFADRGSREVDAWQSAATLVTPEWVQSCLSGELVTLIMDGVDEFLANHNTLTVESVSQLLRGLDESSEKQKTQCILAIRNTLPAIAELSHHRDDNYEIAPLSETAAEELFPGTRELLEGFNDPNLRRLILSPLVLVRLGPRAELIRQKSLNTRASILRHALEALIEESKLSRLRGHAIPLHAWVEALDVVAWIIFRDNLGSIIVDDLVEAAKQLKQSWSQNSNQLSHGFREGLGIFEEEQTVKALRSRTVLDPIGKDEVRFTHREWEDFLVAEYVGQCALAQMFEQLDRRAFPKQIYIDGGEVLSEQMRKMGSSITAEWLEPAFVEGNPFARPWPLMNICALVGNGNVDIDQNAFRRLLDLICQPDCPEFTRIVAVSSFGMRFIRADQRDQSMKYMWSDMADALGKIIAQGSSPQRKVTASMAWCYRAELWRRRPSLQNGESEPWPALSAMTDEGVAAARESGIVWREANNRIVTDLGNKSFQIAAAQYPLAVRSLPHEEISLTHYLFLAAASVKAGAAINNIFPYLRSVFDDDSGVAERVERFGLPQLKALFDSCRKASESVLTT